MKPQNNPFARWTNGDAAPSPGGPRQTNNANNTSSGGAFAFSPWSSLPEDNVEQKNAADQKSWICSICGKQGNTGALCELCLTSTGNPHNSSPSSTTTVPDAKVEVN